MRFTFSGTLNSDHVSFTGTSGDEIVLPTTHPNYSNIRETIAYLRFLENVVANPRKPSIDALINFVETSDVSITDDGHLLVYLSETSGLKIDPRNAVVVSVDDADDEYTEFEDVEDDIDELAETIINLEHIGIRSFVEAEFEDLPDDVDPLDDDESVATEGSFYVDMDTFRPSHTDEAAATYYGSFKPQPDAIHERSDVKVEPLNGGVKASFDFFDNGIGYNFELQIDSKGNPALNVHEFHPRMVKHVEIVENKTKQTPTVIADRNEIVRILRGGETVGKAVTLPASSPRIDKSVKKVTVPTLTYEYDSLDGTLTVEFRNGTAIEYYDVPASVIEEFDDAESKGRFFNDRIRDCYTFSYR